MRKREHEFRIHADEMSAKVLEYELKVKNIQDEKKNKVKGKKVPFIHLRGKCNTYHLQR